MPPPGHDATARGSDDDDSDAAGDETDSGADSATEAKRALRQGDGGAEPYSHSAVHFKDPPQQQWTQNVRGETDL